MRYLRVRLVLSILLQNYKISNDDDFYSLLKLKNLSQHSPERHDPRRRWRYGEKIHARKTGVQYAVSASRTRRKENAAANVNIAFLSKTDTDMLLCRMILT